MRAAGGRLPARTVKDPDRVPPSKGPGRGRPAYAQATSCISYSPGEGCWGGVDLAQMETGLRTRSRACVCDGGGTL